MKVAIDDISAFSLIEIDERISYGWFVYEDKIETPLKLALIDSLEVRILREDPDTDLPDIRFSWDIVSYDEQFMTIQLDIENPENIGEDFGAPDNVLITFWDTKYFKSTHG